jgi:hypothetical protein
MDINAAMTTATASMINSIGLSATYTPVSGSPASITVLFDNDYKAIDLASGVVASLGPVAFCKSADLTGTVKGGSLVVSSVTYTITNIEPDGTGMTLLRLKKA